MIREFNFSKDLLPIFQQRFGEPEFIVRSPGRINLLGEHTDYNLGFVLPAAIDLAIYIALNRREDNELHWYASDLNQYYQGRKERLISDDRGWPNYWLGAIQQLEKSGYSITGFNAVVASDLPVGAGLSSSAALTCGILFALNRAFQFQIPTLRLIQMAQATEHEFIGLQCGIMDQFASMMGKAKEVILLDCRSLDHSYFPFHFPETELVLLDTGVKHSLAATAYNRRREECLTGVEQIKKVYPEVQSLRDATVKMVQEIIPADTEIYLRCLYVIQENERVLQSAAQLRAGDYKGFGKNMFATHAGLSSQYEVSCAEADFLVDLARESEEVAGARMMGGGFGGCVLVLMSQAKKIDWIKKVQEQYFAKFNLPLFDYSVAIGEGTSFLQ
ncbi:MAG: galactokinase [Sediminibacterium sp.]